jgi:hypothetical protein
VQIFDMTQGDLGFRETRKRFIMGIVSLVLGVGVLVFSEMKLVYLWAFLFVLFWGRGLGDFSGQGKDVSHSRGARDAQS